MILTKRFWKQFFSFALMFSVLFSGQSIGHAEEQYTENVVPAMTSDTSPSGKASASRVFNNNFAYYAFDRITSNHFFSDKIPVWLEYEFETPKQIQQYNILPKSNHIAPKDWTFEAWDGSDWIVLDTQKSVFFKVDEKKTFSFSNNSSFQKYRLNITAGAHSQNVSITDIEMMEKILTNPEPEPEPEPQPEPTGDNTLLVIKMISGLEKEFELSASEVQDFIDWYNGRADGRGKETYMFDKDFNKGPFTSRKDYVAFSKIQSFEVMEYSK